MLEESRTILENINTVTAAAYSDKKKGAGYHKNGNGVHTVSYVVNAFLGSITMQGTLAQYPSDNDDDWVEIDSFAGDSTLYNSPGGDTIDYTYSNTFTGKFVWIRAKYTLQNGTIREIRYNY